MMKHSMIYVRKHGIVDLFIAFTSNRKWLRIVNELLSNQFLPDRHELIARDFLKKPCLIIQLIMKRSIFDDVLADIYTIQWEKKRIIPNSLSGFDCR